MSATMNKSGARNISIDYLIEGSYGSLENS